MDPLLVLISNLMRQVIVFENRIAELEAQIKKPGGEAGAATNRP